MSTLIVIFAVAAGVLVALVRFANVEYPPGGFLGFGYHQLLLALTFFAAILSFAFLIVDKGPFAELGVGFWLVFLGSLATLVGSVILTNETKARAQKPAITRGRPAYRSFPRPGYATTS